MKNVSIISEAASLGLHAMAYIAESPDHYVSTNEIANEIKGSKHHLAKVIHKLVLAGYLKSKCGPKGGVKLAKPPEEITYLDIFNAIEGPISDTDCILAHETCHRNECIFSDLRDELYDCFSTYFKSKNLRKYLQSRNGKESNDD